MSIEIVLSVLRDRPRLYSEIDKFSEKPGIYAFFYRGSADETVSLPFDLKTLLYVGKTESSQKSRDANTHFKIGKTGSSTVRKSIGAILHTDLDLNPIPRNDSDYKKGRKSHFKFDNASEERLTEWMMKNISMTFYEFDDSKEALDELETKLIENLVPPLNIDHKNPKNPYLNDLKKLRKNCALIAQQQQGVTSEKVETISLDRSQQRLDNGPSIGKKGKYSMYWTGQLSTIRTFLSESKTKVSIQLLRTDFHAIGDRKRYSFNLQFKAGKVLNNIRGSAVARDLAKVMIDDSQIRVLLKKHEYKFKLDSSFIFHMERI